MNLLTYNVYCIIDIITTTILFATKCLKLTKTHGFSLGVVLFHTICWEVGQHYFILPMNCQIYTCWASVKVRCTREAQLLEQE